jgi:hypothetical protein
MGGHGDQIDVILGDVIEPTFRTVPSHLRHFLCAPGGAVKSPHQ